MKNSLQIAIVILFLSFAGYMPGQDKAGRNVVLTEAQIEKMLADEPIEKQVEFYDSLANNFRIQGKDTVKALQYVNKALELGEQIPYSFALAHALFIRSKCYRDMLKYKKALKDLDSALVIFKRLDEKAWVGTVYADYGNIYYKKSDYNKALEGYLKGLEYGEKSGDKELTNICLNNVGNIYFLNKNYDKAIEYYLKSYDVNKSSNNLARSASILDNISMVYTTKGEYDMALVYATTAAKTVEKMDKTGNVGLLGEIYMNIGTILNSMKKQDSALEYYKKAYQ
nr:tetratricopeptide repeat protein [Bacteroidota bacterium]